MNFCPYCKQPIADHSLYCPICNKPLISNIDYDINKKIGHYHYESSFYVPDFEEEEEEYDLNIVNDELIEQKLSETEIELEESERLGKPMGSLLLKKASLYYKKRDLSTALKNLELALNNFLNEENLLQIGISYNEIGLIYEEMGYYEQAIYHLDRSLSSLQEINDTHKIIQVLNNLGNIYLLIKDYNQSYKNYQSALNLAEKENIELEAIKTSSNLVEVLFNLEQYDRITKILKNNFDFFKKNNDIYGIIQILIKYGKLYYYLGENYYDQSYESLNNALELINNVKDQLSIYIKASLEWECFHYLGKLNILWDNDIEAEDYLLKSLEAIRTYEIKEHIKEGLILEDIAKLYAVKGEDDKAIEYFKYSSEIYLKFGDKLKLAEIKYQIAKIYQNYLQIESESIKFYEEALEIFENFNSSKNAADILTILGNIYAANEMDELALSYYDRATNYYRILHDDYNEKLIIEKIRSLHGSKTS